MRHTLSGEETKLAPKSANHMMSSRNSVVETYASLRGNPFLPPEIVSLTNVRILSGC